MSSLVWLLLLVIVAAVVVAVVVVRRRPEVPAPPPAALPEPDDLVSLGLSEVRARPASARPPDPVRFSDLPGPGGRERSAAAPAPASPAPTGPPAWGVDEGAWGEAPVRYLLRSLAADSGGPVAVVRHEGARFRVAARTDGGPLASIRGTPLDLDGPTVLDRAALGGLATLVGGEARALALGPYVVLLGGAEGPAAGYVELLAALTGIDLPAADVPAPARPAPAPVSAPAAEADAPPVPRAAIIAEEQAAAREAGGPLAFALVTLADAEERLTQGSPEAVAEAERALRDRLATAERVHRVEPFGDLLFGVFLPLDPADTAAWCDRLASGAPPLFIGAVAPAVGDPTGIRDAAAEALHDAYDQQRSRVVEVDP